MLLNEYESPSLVSIKKDIRKSNAYGQMVRSASMSGIRMRNQSQTNNRSELYPTIRNDNDIDCIYTKSGSNNDVDQDN